MKPIYTGNWVLIPELSFYEVGEPPLWGKYSISVENAEASIVIDWADSEGEIQSISLGGPIDGKFYPSETDKSLLVAFEQVDDLTLDSRVQLNGTDVAYARRRSSEQGDLLATLQIGTDENGNNNRTTQVYRKASS